MIYLLVTCLGPSRKQPISGLLFAGERALISPSPSIWRAAVASFWALTRSLQSFCPPHGWSAPSCCFQDSVFVFTFRSFTMTWLSGHCFGFILLVVHSTSWISRFFPFAAFEKFLAATSLRTFKCHSCWTIGCSSSSTVSPVLPVVPTMGTTFKDTTLRERYVAETIWLVYMTECSWGLYINF